MSRTGQTFCTSRVVRITIIVVTGALLATGCTAMAPQPPPGSVTADAGASASTPNSAGQGDLTSAPIVPPVDPDRPRSSIQLPPAPDTPVSPTPQEIHDDVLASLLTSLGTALQEGNRTRFLTPFAPAIAAGVGQWFDNTRALGVAGVLFSRSDDYSSGATDSADSFTRTVVLGIRTPYDDDGSMAGIPYLVTVSTTSRTRVSVTTWTPKYVGDPMACRCKLSVVHTQAVAVVFDSSDPDLAFWSNAALAAAGPAISWTRAQMLGSGLVAPKGQVIFLADKPFHWFLTATGPPQASNVTVGLITALGAYPGTTYSDQSRIVIMLATPDGTVIPNDESGREYAADVITHESTHQLMNRNSHLSIRTDSSPPIWAVEGIAAAVETLYRDSLGDAANIGYPEPNDPKNIDPAWFRTHLTDQMPTRAQLYSPSADGAGYYAIAGSVFRYLDARYGYPAMMRVAAALYALPDQDPFAYFPDPAAPGRFLPAAAAKSAWKGWFVRNYER